MADLFAKKLQRGRDNHCGNRVLLNFLFLFFAFFLVPYPVLRYILLIVTLQSRELN